MFNYSILFCTFFPLNLSRNTSLTEDTTQKDGGDRGDIKIKKKNKQGAGVKDHLQKSSLSVNDAPTDTSCICT